jgi:hypothetical protein
MLKEYVQGNLDNVLKRSRFTMMALTNPHAYTVIKNIIMLPENEQKLRNLKKAYFYKKSKKLYGISFKKEKDSKKTYAILFLYKRNLNTIAKNMSVCREYREMYERISEFACKEMSLTGKNYKNSIITYHDKKVKIVNKNPITFRK